MLSLFYYYLVDDVMQLITLILSISASHHYVCQDLTRHIQNYPIALKEKCISVIIAPLKYYNCFPLFISQIILLYEIKWSAEIRKIKVTVLAKTLLIKNIKFDNHFDNYIYN